MYAPAYAEPKVPSPSTGTSAQIDVSDISTVSISGKIPDFWPENPRLWFMQVEAILAPQKTSDANKYYMVVAKLSKEAIQQVADILSNPPEQNKFEVLKNRLLQIYEESETRQIQKLISEVELGDQKPSQLLRRMKELARGKIEDDTLNILWQGHLPSSVRAVLTVTSSQDLDSLSNIADKIMETYQPARISEVSRSRTETVNAYDVATIMAEISKINLRIAELDKDRGRTRGRSRSRSRSRNFSHSRTRSSRTPDSPNWLCSYHYKYRSRARKCIPPCNWRSPTSSSQAAASADMGN